MIEDLAPGDRVWHTSGRLGVVLAVKTRWRMPAVQVRFDGSRYANWVPRAKVRRLNPPD